MKTSLLLATLSALATTASFAAPATYDIDPNHTYPSFEADHMGISMWRGKLDKSSGKLVLDKDAGTGTVEITIDLKSIDFGQDALNKWAVGPEFFDTAKYPTAVYKGKLEGFKAGGNPKVTGELTLHGVTKPVTLEATYNGGYAGHPYDPHARIGFSAKGTLKRSDFGVAYGIPAPGTTMGVFDDVEIIVESEFSGPPLPGAAAPKS